MFLMNEKGSGAGVLMIANPFKRANNSYMSDYYNTSNPTKCYGYEDHF